MSGTKGNSGRPRKPSYLKLVEGTTRKDRKNLKEPKPKINLVKAPKGLHKEVEEEFKKLALITYDMGIISEWDVIALEICAIAIVEYRHATKILVEKGSDIKHMKDGQQVIMKRSEVTWAEGAFRRASSMLAKFGLSP